MKHLVFATLSFLAAYCHYTSESPKMMKATFIIGVVFLVLFVMELG